MTCLARRGESVDFAGFADFSAPLANSASGSDSGGVETKVGKKIVDKSRRTLGKTAATE
jgi:hypothetical protein